MRRDILLLARYALMLYRTVLYISCTYCALVESTCYIKDGKSTMKGCDWHGVINGGRQEYGSNGVYLHKEWI